MLSRRSATFPRAFARALCKSIAASLCVSVVATQTLAAQSAHRWSVQGSGLFVTAGGDAFEGLSAGPGGEIQARYSPSAFSIGLGLQGSWHKFKDDVELEGVDGVALVGGFVEPRYVFAIGSDRAAPYIAARVTYLRQQADFTSDAGEDFSLAANGTQVNGGGGVLVRMSSRVNLDLGATFGAIKFGDYKVSDSSGASVSLPDTKANGTNIVVRVGLSIGLGR